MKCGARLVLLLFAAASSAAAATISVDAEAVLHERPTSLIGGNIKDLNFQLYGGLYSQLIHGECFEEHVDRTDLFELEGPDRFAVWVLPDRSGQPVLRMHNGRGQICQEDGTVVLGDDPRARGRKDQVWEFGVLAFRGTSVLFPRDLPETLRDKLVDLATGDRQVSCHWRPVVSASAKGRFTLVGKDVHTGIRAQQIVFLSGKGEVGIDNAGLFRAGIKLVGGKPYEGLLRVQSDKPLELYVSLRDANGGVLAEEVRKLSGNETEYQSISFALTPGRSAAAGRFAVALRSPGTITVDYAFLQADEWLPVVLHATSSDPLLDVTAKKSRDSTVLTLYVVNLKDEVVATELSIEGFNAAESSVLQIGSPDLTAKNTVEHPEQIKANRVEWNYSLDRPSISLPGRSFTSIRLAAKEPR